VTKVKPAPWNAATISASARTVAASVAWSRMTAGACAPCAVVRAMRRSSPSVQSSLSTFQSSIVWPSSAHTARVASSYAP
jgi:hypothetical protein